MSNRPGELSAQQVAAMVAGELRGDPHLRIRGVGDIRSANQGELCFIAAPKYLSLIPNCAADLWLINPELYESLLDEKIKSAKTFVLVPHPYLAFVKVVSHFFPLPVSRPGIHPLAFVHETAEIHSSAQIDAFVSVGARSRIEAGVILKPGTWIDEDVSVGEGSLLYGNVSVYNQTQIGKRNIIHAGAVLGADGFGFVKDHDQKQVKIPQVGRVVLHDDVEVGANTCIDRSTIGDTVIGEGTKLDNQIQIAHNCEIGKNNVVCAMSGLAGGTKMGDGVVLAGGVHVGGHLTIGDGASIAGLSGVTKDVAPRQNMKGYPLRPVNEFLKIQGLLVRLPEIYKRLQKLEEQKDG